MASYGKDRPNVATGSGSTKSSKKKPAKAKGYDWGDGRKVHSIPVEQHNANKGGVATYGLTPNQPLDAPLTAAQGYAMAQAAANRTYAPQLAANAQLQSNTPAWYQNYITRTGEAQKAAQAQAQPILNTAQAAVGNAAQTAPGLDASSPQYAAEQQAAKGRETMAQDSSNYLAGVAAATNAYFGGQANIAARELPQVQAGLTYQAGQLGAQRQDAATQAYGDIRAGEQNASIARQTLGLNTASAAADVDLKRGVDPVTGKALPQEAPKGYAPGGPGLNKYGFTYDQWSGMSTGAQAKERNRGSTKKSAADAEKKRKEAETKKTAIKTATGGVQTKVHNLITQWNNYRGQVTDDTTKLKDPVTGEYPARKVTASDVKRILGQKNDAELIHAMLLIRAGKPLDQASIDYLHRKDPNIRIPREWLRGKQEPGTLDRPNRAAAPKNDKSGYGDRPN